MLKEDQGFLQIASGGYEQIKQLNRLICEHRLKGNGYLSLSKIVSNLNIDFPFGHISGEEQLSFKGEEKSLFFHYLRDIRTKHIYFADSL